MNSHCLFCLVFSLRFLVLYCCFEFLVTLSKDKKFQKKWHTNNISKFASKWHEMRFKCAFDHSNEISVNTISSASSASSESSLCGGATPISDGIFSNQNQNSISDVAFQIKVKIPDFELVVRRRLVAVEMSSGGEAAVDSVQVFFLYKKCFLGRDYNLHCTLDIVLVKSGC